MLSEQNASSAKCCKLRRKHDRSRKIHHTNNNMFRRGHVNFYARRGWHLAQVVEPRSCKLRRKPDRSRTRMIQDTNRKPVVPGENNRSFTLEQAGITRDLSSRAQKIAAIPKAEFPCP